jgi:hypothetical protein
MYQHIILVLFRKTNFFRGIPFHSVLFRASELALPRNLERLGMSAFFRGIAETVPSIFRGIFCGNKFRSQPYLLFIFPWGGGRGSPCTLILRGLKFLTDQSSPHHTLLLFM